MKVFSSESHRLHFPNGELFGGEFVRPFECPERWDYIVDRLKQRGYSNFVTPGELDLSVVAKVHSQDYIQFLENAWNEWAAEGYTADALPTVVPARRMQQRIPNHIDGKLGYYCMAMETAITSGTWQAVKSSAACAIYAQKQVISEGSAFALCRPPGHHSGKDLYGGYCFLNNAAIAVQSFLDDGAKRVALLDVDFHHGNGSQDIFYDRDDVLFLSLHGRPEDAFPHFLGYQDEYGASNGEGFNVNFPMPPDTTYDLWGDALNQACKKITEFSPDAVVVSLGVDTFEDDPISFFKLSSDNFKSYGERIGQLKLPTLFVMEGGYAVEEIGVNTVNVLDAYQGA